MDSTVWIFNDIDDGKKLLSVFRREFTIDGVTWRFWAHGNHQAVFEALLAHDLRIGSQVYPAGTRLVYRVPLSALTGNDIYSAMLMPRRVARVFNEINSQRTRNDNLVPAMAYCFGVIEPFIDGEPLTDYALSEAILAIYVETGSVILDGISHGNLIKASNNRTYCVDSDFRFRRASLTSPYFFRNSYCQYDKWFSHHSRNSALLPGIKMTKALLYLTVFTKFDHQLAGILKDNSAWVELLASAYDNCRAPVVVARINNGETSLEAIIGQIQVVYDFFELVRGLAVKREERALFEDNILRISQGKGRFATELSLFTKKYSKLKNWPGNNFEKLHTMLCGLLGMPDRFQTYYDLITCLRTDNPREVFDILFNPVMHQLLHLSSEKIIELLGKFSLTELSFVANLPVDILTIDEMRVIINNDEYKILLTEKTDPAVAILMKYQFSADFICVAHAGFTREIADDADINNIMSHCCAKSSSVIVLDGVMAFCQRVEKNYTGNSNLSRETSEVLRYYKNLYSMAFSRKKIIMDALPHVVSDTEDTTTFGRVVLAM